MNTQTVFCQSCGMPLDNEGAAETDENVSGMQDYCIYCYKDGVFTKNCTMEEMISISLEHMKEIFKDHPGFNEQKALDHMKSFFPTLKRWKQ